MPAGDTEAARVPAGRGLPAIAAPPSCTRRLGEFDVVDGEVPPRWDAAITAPSGCADERAVLLHHGPAALYVADGRTVVVQAPDDDTRSAYDFLVYSIAARFLAQQQQRFLLHAVALVSPQGRCLAVMGDSGAGKTTASVALQARGWRLASDDSPLAEPDGAATWLRPDARPSHLTAAAVLALGGDPAIGRPVPGTEKLAVGLEQDLAARPLEGLVVLGVGDVDRPVVVPLAPTAAVPLLCASVDHGGVGLLPGLRGPLLAWAAGIAATVPVHRVIRPAGRPTEQVTADAVASVL